MHTDSTSPRAPIHPLSSNGADSDDFQRCLKALDAQNDTEVYQLLKTLPGLQWIKDSAGRRLIHHLVLKKQLHCPSIAALGLDVNVQDYQGLTPLHCAIQLKRAEGQGDIDLVNSLITLQAEINKPDMKGQTPLHYAAHQGSLDIVELLCVQPSINISQQDSNGWTALHWAVTPEQHRRLYLHKDKVSIIQRLCKLYHADPNAQDNEGKTPLHLAVSFFNFFASHDEVKIFFTQITQALIALGASEMVLDNQKQTVLDIDKKGLLKNLSATHPITQLTFSGNFIHTHSPSLENAQPWLHIPQFAILTGPNGSGKSHLLNYIASFLKKLGPDVCYVYKTSQAFDTYTLLKTGHHRTHYPLLDTVQQTQLLEKVRSIIAGELPSALDDLATLTAQRLQHANLALNTLSDATILEYAAQIPVTQKEAFSSSHALSTLGSIFQAYQEKKQKIIDTHRQLSHSKALFSAYCKHIKREENPLIYLDFLNFIEHPHNIEKLLQAIADDKSGTPPWDELNALFEENGLNLQLYYDHQTPQSNALMFTRTWQGRTVSIESQHLSSGESLILDMFAWQYYTAGLSKHTHKKALTQKVAMMLLDEPDRHFDPELSKLFMNCLTHMVSQGIQIIMTTHRTDTLAFAPSNSLFTIKRNTDNIASIHPTTRLHALFKLTPNLRGITNFHIKVHTESLDDATFYEKVYHQLLRLSEDRRKALKVQRQSAHMTLSVTQTQHAPDILSRRFQLSFYSVALDKSGGGGGCHAIPITIQREILALDNLDRTEKNSLIDRKIEYPFGIIDADFDLVTPNPARIKPAFDALKSQLLFTKRHSLENYLYDPALLFSFLNNDDINSWLIDDKLKERALNCHSLVTQPFDPALQATVDHAFEAYFHYFIEKFIAPDKPISKKDYKHHYSYLPTGTLFEQISKPYLQAPEKIACLCQGLSIALQKNIAEAEIVEALLIAHAQDITLLSPEGKPGYTIHYPGLFLYARGHDLEEFTQTLFTNVSFKEQLINKLITSPALSLPMDLVNTIVELDRRVTNQANAIIKPGKKPYQPFQSLLS
jgi:ankyrin repeat protein/ABC-type cobalamin/Fe3+-siderophores transport system ATPase subunit